jgi:cytoskeletal protein CcmA (bactofilin family)
MDKRKANDSTSVLSNKVKFEGEIHGDEDFHVEGYFKGAIKISGNIFVGRNGVVQADVEADNVVIQGKINGNVVARKQLEIRSSGQLLGDCTAQSIDIKEGAVFDGRLNMLQPSLASAGSGTFSTTSAKPGAKNQSK